MLKDIIKPFLIVIFITIISLFVLLWRNQKISQRVMATIPVFLTPTPTEFIPGPIQTETVNSPDGTKTLTMKKQQLKNLTKYSLFTDTLLFEKEEALQSLSIPYNSWSPDNIFLFIKESGSAVNNYYVMYASGNFFPNNVRYINVQALFAEKIPNYTIEDVTGWAAPNLLIVNTKAVDGRKVSFWFDVPSQSFIQLSTYFN